jgi:Holliday junction DNA helicase RuvA
MYAFIKGTLLFPSPTAVVLEAGGLGYKVYIPINILGILPQEGETCTLYTSFIIRELAQTLYGFLCPRERDCFELLLGVTGIGPKLALTLIGHLPSKELQQAIQNHDIPTLCRVPGIGKKGAERLIIELRDKISQFSFNDLAISIPTDPGSQAIKDAMSALINLGYNQATAQKAIKKTMKDFPETIDLATLITVALKQV